MICSAQRLLAIGVCLAATQTAVAVEIPAEQHPWGRFKPGSWQRVRVTTESFSADGGKSMEVRHVTTRLVEVRADGIVLSRETETGDEKKTGPDLHVGWDGSVINDSTREKYSLGEIKIEGKSFACQTQTVTTEIDGETLVTKSWYSPDHAPWFLKRLTRRTGKERRHTVMDVTKRAVTRKVLDRDIPCWESVTHFSTSGGRRKTVSVSSLQLPGGLVYSQSEGFNSDSARNERVVTELVAFEIAR